jgi:plasmid replication initiation protein
MRPFLMQGKSGAEPCRTANSLHNGGRSKRKQLDLLRALPGDLAARDARDLMAYPFFSLTKSRRIVPIDFRAGTVMIRFEPVPEHGMATAAACCNTAGAQKQLCLSAYPDVIQQHEGPS